MKVKIGILGCGRIAQLVHLKILTSLPQAELVAFAESDLNARQLTQRIAPKALALADYREVLEIPEIEAVLICLPDAFHAEAAIAALEKRKHIYLEKPLARNREEGQSILTAWQRSGRIGMMGFNYRFNRLYQELKRRVQSGEIGPLRHARTVFSTNDKNRERQNPWKPSHVLLRLASHHIDLVRFIFDQEIEEVFAELEPQESSHDSATLSLKLVNGLSVQSFFSTQAVEEDRVEIYGRYGKLWVDRYASLDVEKEDASRQGARFKKIARFFQSLEHSPYLIEKQFSPGYHEPSYKKALIHFMDSIKNHAAGQPNLWEGYQSLAVVNAAEESARTKILVRVGDRIPEGVFQNAKS